ncbi:DUF7560 family zinc ribbon protein [Halapricum salinum]|uniref:DUF7560 family zinc ribbon protein n=1 Tax=Halapricum salinum TaxID=1457250 RepID=UPI001476B4E3|nr:hypothetical protein [Halapricum salinum]
MSGSDTKTAFTFVCPECAESLEVNASMRDVLVEKGCVVCSAAVTADAFSQAPAPSS